MSRVLSQAAVASAFAQTTAQVWVILLRIYKPAAPAANYYYVNDWTNATYGGNTYTAWPFEVALPESGDGRPPDLKLKIDNVDRTLIAVLRAQTAPVYAYISVGMASGGAVSAIEAGPFMFTMREISYDALSIEATLTYERVYDEQFPGHCMTPHYCPALFGQIIAAGTPRSDTLGHGGPAYVAGRAKRDK